MSIDKELHIAPTYAVGLSGELLLPCALVVSFAAAVFAGVVPPRRVSGPERIPPDRPAMPLLGVIFGAMGAYLFTASLYATLNHPSPAATLPSRPLADVPPSQMAFFSTVPPLVAFLALLLGGRFSRDACGQDLGLGPGRLRRGVGWGLAGVIIVLPPLFVLMSVLEWLYRLVHYQHPTEHPLLRTLGEKPGALVSVSIGLGACIIAPLAEELFFRGYVQTLLRRMLNRFLARPPEPGAFDVVTPGAQTPGEPSASNASAVPGSAQTWLAIILTSILFAMVHPLWTAPIIFILSVCLGYAYERTSNLWVSIIIHSGFNTLSTILFLRGLYAPG